MQPGSVGTPSASRWEAGAEPITGYRLLKPLGRGLTGEVWSCAGPFGVSKAIKRIPVPGDLPQVQAGLACLRRFAELRHEHLLNIDQCQLVDNHLIIIMELAEKSLQDLLDEYQNSAAPGIPRGDLLEYIRQAATALDFMLQKHGLVHLDVKPSNLLLVNGRVKIGDFNVAASHSPATHTHTVIAHTPAYSASELLAGETEETCDQFSLAVCYYQLLVGRLPFQSSEPRELRNEHVRPGPDLSRLPECDRSAVKRALQAEGKNRWRSCGRFLQALTDAAAADHKIEIPKSAPAANSVKSASVKPTGPTSLSASPRPTTGNRLHVPGRGRKRVENPAEPIETRIHESVVEIPDDAEVVRETFIAYLPQLIFAHKLRAFLDDAKPMVITCSDEKSIFLFPNRKLLGILANRGLYLMIETRPAKLKDYRLVEVTIWSPELRGPEFEHRCRVLIRDLQGYLMGDDKSALWST